jgi:hypothetical protein
MVVFVVLPMACSQEHAPKAQKQWQQVAVRPCEPHDLGGEEARLRSLFWESIGPLRSARAELHKGSRQTEYELMSVSCHRADIDGDPLFVAGGEFIERGVPHVDEMDALVTAVIFRGRISIIAADNGLEGLLPREPVSAWRFSGTPYVRLLLKENSMTYSMSSGSCVQVVDYNLGTGKCINCGGVGASEHMYNVEMQLETRFAGNRMVLTATHPNDGKSRDAYLDTEWSVPGVRIEQLRRTCIRVTLPNPDAGPGGGTR